VVARGIARLSIASDHRREDQSRCGEQYCLLAGDRGHSRLYGGRLQTVAGCLSAPDSRALRNRLARLPDNPNRALVELRIELPPRLYRPSPVGDISMLRGEAHRSLK
jgi:hypothetical protein